MNYIIYPVLIKSSDGKKIIEIMPDRLLYPTFIFAKNTRDMNNFSRSSIIDKLEGKISLDILRYTIIKSIEYKESRQNSNTNTNTAELIRQQKEEYENLEKIEKKKKQVELEKLKKIEIDRHNKQKEVFLLI